MKWKILKENENYSINEKGEIKNNITKKILSPSINKDSGYYQIDLWKNNKSRKYTLHRLVANNFIPNLENKPTVDHIDGNRLNNDISNLRWATYSEQNSRFNTFGVRSEKIKVINVNGEELIFNRIKDVAEHFNCNISNISQMLKKEHLEKEEKQEIINLFI